MSAAGPIRVACAAGTAAGLATLTAAVAEPGGQVVVSSSRTAADLVRDVARVEPDVVAVDLDLPGRPGGPPGVIQAVEELMRRRALAVLVLSGSEHQDGSLAVSALAAGAVDVLPRPGEGDPPVTTARLRRRIGVLSRLPMVTRRAGTPTAATPPPTAPPGAVGPVVAIASSTGGPGALLELLAGLGRPAAPVLLVQHIHADFTESFARWLEAEAGLRTVVGQAGRTPAPGQVVVAPSDVHLRLGRDGRLVLDPQPDLLARPSGDELLASVAEAAGSRAVGVVLTGMGEDGARGLLAIRRAGGTTYAQDAGSVVVDGMPGAARRLGAAQRSLAPRAIGVAVAAHLAGTGAGA